MPRKSEVSREETEKLINLVQNESCIYDLTDPDYHDKLRLFNTWDRISKEMGNELHDGDSWRKKWRNLRDTYVKKRRDLKLLKSGQAAGNRVFWPFMDQLSFLEKHVQDNITQSNILLEKSSEVAIGGDEVQLPSECENSSEDEICRSSSTMSISTMRRSLCGGETPTPPKSKKRRQKHVDGSTSESSMEELVSCYKQRSAEQREETNGTAEDAFFKNCRLRIKHLPPQIQSQVQFQISQLFFNAENPDLAPQEIIPLTRSHPKHNDSSFSLGPGIVHVLPDANAFPENVISAIGLGNMSSS